MCKILLASNKNHISSYEGVSNKDKAILLIVVCQMPREYSHEGIAKEEA